MARTTHHSRWRSSTSERHLPAGRHRSRPHPPAPDAHPDAPAGATEAQYWNVTVTRRHRDEKRTGARRRRDAPRLRGRMAPQERVRTVAWFGYTATFHAEEIDAWCAVLERTERTRVRDELRTARSRAQGILNGADASEDAWYELGEVAPTRHRSSARWRAC